MIFHVSDFFVMTNMHVFSLFLCAAWLHAASSTQPRVITPHLRVDGAVNPVGTCRCTKKMMQQESAP